MSNVLPGLELLFLVLEEKDVNRSLGGGNYAYHY